MVWWYVRWHAGCFQSAPLDARGESHQPMGTIRVSDARHVAFLGAVSEDVVVNDVDVGPRGREDFRKCP